MPRQSMPRLEYDDTPDTEDESQILGWFPSDEEEVVDATYGADDDLEDDNDDLDEDNEGDDVDLDSDVSDEDGDEGELFEDVDDLEDFEDD